MKVKISLPFAKEKVQVSCEFASQESAELAMSVYSGRLSLSEYGRLMNKLESKSRANR